jgi:hypothetical protein
VGFDLLSKPPTNFDAARNDDAGDRSEFLKNNRARLKYPLRRSGWFKAKERSIVTTAGPKGGDEIESRLGLHRWAYHEFQRLLSD